MYHKPFSLIDVCSLMKGCSLGLYNSDVLLCFFVGRPITVTSFPFGRPHFLMEGGMKMSVKRYRKIGGAECLEDLRYLYKNYYMYMSVDKVQCYK